MAFALENLDKYEEAISYYDQLLAIDSSDIDALNGKALALESLGREDEAISILEDAIELIPTEPEFRVPLEETINQDNIVESDQILFVIIGIVIVIVVSIILINLIIIRRKTVTKSDSSVTEQEPILSTPSSNNEKDSRTNLEVAQAIKVLQNLADMNLLNNPKTAKQFLLNKGFSEEDVKNAMHNMGMDPSYVDD